MQDPNKIIYTNEANRWRKIYILAIFKEENLDRLYPPATEEEIREFQQMSKEMREQEAEARKEGRPLMWDIPFDVDY